MFVPRAAAAPAPRPPPPLPLLLLLLVSSSLLLDLAASTSASASAWATPAPPSALLVVPPPTHRLSPAAAAAAASAPSLPRSSASAASASASALRATWSNGQAVREYQDFLATGQSEPTLAEDRRSVIVAPSSGERSALVEAIGSMGDGDDAVATPGTPLPPSLGGESSYPIYVALPPTELGEFLTTLPDDWSARREDMVFFSGGKACGCVEKILKDRGYCRDSMTQVLAGGFTTPGLPKKPQDLSAMVGLSSSGEEKWAGESAVCGKWAGSFASRLERNGVRCAACFYRDWRRRMWERATYDAVFTLVGALRDEPTTLAQVASYYGDEVSDMVWEVTSRLRGHLAVTLLYGFEERMFGFGEMRGGGDHCVLDPAMYEYMFPVPIRDGPKVAEYLNYAHHLGKLPGVEVPRIKEGGGDRPSAMLQGNLRADGVI